MGDIIDISVIDNQENIVIDVSPNVITVNINKVEGTVLSVNGQQGAVVITKASLGLGNVDNTSDANKPISSATQTALNLKANTSALGTAAFTNASAYATSAQGAKADTALQAGNNISLLTNDSGYITSASFPVTSVNTKTGAVVLNKTDIGLANVDNTSDASKPISTATQTALNAKENSITATTAADYYRGDKTFQALNKTAVGLANVDNTSDANKPVSSATQTALNLKANTASLGTAAFTNSTAYATAAQGTKADTALQAGNNVSALVNDAGYLTSLAGAVTSVNGASGAVTITKSTVGLSNVDNTSDLSKPISTATQTALNAKQDSLGFTPENSANKGAAGGYASLDGAGKVPVSQLPNSIMEYKGTWNASTNTPTLADGTGNTGDVYRVSVAGTQNLGSGSISFSVGDYAVYNGTAYEKSGTTDSVSSVNGLTGAVTLTTANISDTTNKRYVTDANLTVLGNTSGTNTGDQDLSGLVVKNSTIVAATKTKITYDAKGLVTAGSDATTADIADSTNKRYVTDAQATVIGNTSGTNTGDETTATIKTKLGAASSLQDGYLTSANWSTFNAKQAAITGAATSITASDLTINRALLSDASGKVAVSATTSTELGYLSGVTSAIQTQLNAKQGTITPAALTKTDDTNVTLALGGTPATALLQGVSLTLGWTGTLADGRIASAATWNAKESALTFSAPLSRSVNTISMPVATAIANGYLSSTDWSTFNSKQATITGAATTITSSNLTIRRALASDVNGKVSVSATTEAELGYLSGVTSAIQTQLDAKGSGTVTSVAALTLGTTGTDLSSSVATGTTTPVITLNVPTASATNRGALSSTDWSTFNGKAPLASPTFTGTPAAPTAAVATNTTQLATTAYVQQEKLRVFNRQTASYTLVLSDRDKVIEMNVASGACNLTIPLDSSVAFPIGTEIQVMWYGVVQPTIVTTGLTPRSESNWLKIGARYTGVTLLKVGANEWYIAGRLSA